MPIFQDKLEGEDISDELKDLLKGLLAYPMANIITVKQFLEHPWIQKGKNEIDDSRSIMSSMVDDRLKRRYFTYEFF